MKKIDYMLWAMAQDDKLRDEINTSYVAAQTENIKQQRDLVKNFMIISAGIVGFSVPILNDTGLVTEKEVFIWSLLFFTSVIVYGFWYLKIIIEKENTYLTEQHNWFAQLLDEKVNSRNRFFSTQMTNQDINNYQAEQATFLVKMEKRKTLPPAMDYAHDILFGIFISGVALMVVSIIGFEPIVSLVVWFKSWLTLRGS